MTEFTEFARQAVTAEIRVQTLEGHPLDVLGRIDIDFAIAGKTF